MNYNATRFAFRVAGRPNLLHEIIVDSWKKKLFTVVIDGTFSTTRTTIGARVCNIVPAWFRAPVCVVLSVAYYFLTRKDGI